MFIGFLLLMVQHSHTYYGTACLLAPVIDGAT